MKGNEATSNLLVVLLVILSYGCLCDQDWIAREKIHAGWIYHSDGADKLDHFRKQGMNALITHAGDLAKFDLWATEARRAGMHLFGVLGFSFDAEKAGMRRAVFGNGYESVVARPTDERFWQERMIAPAVQLAEEGMTAEKEISGILIDFELYANESKGGQTYYTDACYCNHCFGEFLKSKSMEDVSQQVAYGERVKWLKDKSVFSEYHPFLQKQVRMIAVKMREAVEAVRKDFFLGFYPVPHNWMLVGVAQGLGTPEHPMILWATDTYGGGGAQRIPDNWREEFQKKEMHCYYCGGMLLRCYASENFAANMVQVALKGSGYWLFTVHTLCIREEEQSGDYYLASGSPDDYLREIRRANSELDKLCADPNYRPNLVFVQEPVRYRHVGFDIGRFKPPKLVDKSEVEHGSDISVGLLPLIEGNHLMMLLKEGEEAALHFRTDKAKSGEVWGVSYAVIDATKEVITRAACLPAKKPPFASKLRAPAFSPSSSARATLVAAPC